MFRYERRRRGGTGSFINSASKRSARSIRRLDAEVIALGYAFYTEVGFEGCPGGDQFGGHAGGARGLP